MSKEKLRKEISIDVERFLAAGGKIEVVPSETVCPPSMQWAADRGFDYSPWCELGSSEWYESLDSGVDVDVDWVALED